MMEHLLSVFCVGSFDDVETLNLSSSAAFVAALL